MASAATRLATALGSRLSTWLSEAAAAGSSWQPLPTYVPDLVYPHASPWSVSTFTEPTAPTTLTTVSVSTNDQLLTALFNGARVINCVAGVDFGSVGSSAPVDVVVNLPATSAIRYFELDSGTARVRLNGPGKYGQIALLGPTVTDVVIDGVQMDPHHFGDESGCPLLIQRGTRVLVMNSLCIGANPPSMGGLNVLINSNSVDIALAHNNFLVRRGLADPTDNCWGIRVSSTTSPPPDPGAGPERYIFYDNYLRTHGHEASLRFFGSILRMFSYRNVYANLYGTPTTALVVDTGSPGGTMDEMYHDGDIIAGANHVDTIFARPDQWDLGMHDILWHAANIDWRFHDSSQLDAARLATLEAVATHGESLQYRNGSPTYTYDATVTDALVEGAGTGGPGGAPFLPAWPTRTCSANSQAVGSDPAAI